MPKNITAGIEMKIIKNLLRLPTNLVDLILKFNSLIFETNRKLDTTKINIKTSYLKIIFENQFPSSEIIEKEQIKIALAGVGKPLKKFDPDFVILKRANLYADAAVIIKPKNGINDEKIEPTTNEGAALNMLYSSIPGTKPKLTISARESS